MGVLFRFTDLAFPDFSTDEAQAALAATAAWTPAGMTTFRMTQMLFGHSILVVRLTAALFGIAFLPLLYFLAREYVEKERALLITAVAALFPSHILFSRMAYLSTQLLFAWTLTLYCFLHARETKSQKWLVALFLGGVYATMVKTQGLVLPILLAIGTVVEGWRYRSLRTTHCALLTALCLSLLPVSLYIATHPGIAATTLLYGGNLYGVTDLPTRISDLLATWWHVLSLFAVAMLLSFRSLPSFSWPLWIALGWFSVHGLFLGPGNPYYATELALFALPIGLGMSRLTPLLRSATLCILLGTTLMLLGPRSLFKSPLTLDPFRNEPYWNTHAASINEALAGEEAVTVFGYPGHELRWYLEPRIFVGRNMTPPYSTRDLLFLQNPRIAKEVGSVIYDDGQTTIVRQRE